MFLVRAKGSDALSVSVFPAAAIPRTYLTHANTLIHTAIFMLTLARHCIDLFLCLGSMGERDRGE